jgi:Peptidase family S41
MGVGWQPSPIWPREDWTRLLFMLHKYFIREFCALRRAAVSLGLAAMLLVGEFAWAATPSSSVDFQEVYQLLKANLAGATDASLSEAAVKGLLSELGTRASLVDDPAADGGNPATQTPVTSEVFEKNYGYFRVQRLTTGTADAMRSQFNQLRATNSVKGLVLDLRYAGGQDYGAAAALADLFMANETVLVDWGEGVRKSSTKTNAISVPVALLVNRKTSGAAEALAGMLRHREVGLLIGTNTAGQASMSKIFTLKTGQRLRVAVAPLKVSDGRELPESGMKPDIGVAVSPEDELAYYEDAYKVLAKAFKVTTAPTNELHASTTNRSPRRRMNEAELVRMSREGQAIDRETVAANPTPPLPEPIVPVVTDPALARALDLLKGLAVVQQFRAN